MFKRVKATVGGSRTSSDGLVQKRSDVLLTVPVRSAQHHYAILDAESVQMV